MFRTILKNSLKTPFSCSDVESYTTSLFEMINKRRLKDQEKHAIASRQLQNQQLEKAI